jgi:hypothetical protein
LNVFTPTCTGSCHAGGAPSGGLNLEAANSYAELLGVPSNQEAGIVRVVPNDPDNSYLIHKLENTQTVGSQMPPVTPLPQTSIDTIRAWITNGAIDDTALPPAAPVRVTSLSPMPNQNLTAGPMQIVAGFNRALDATSVTTATFTLTGSGGDGNFGNGNEVLVTPASVTVPGANPMSAIMDLGGVMLADDTYRVTLVGTGAAVIMDLGNNALDGEFGGLFPSGNGTAGGNFLTQFVVATPAVLGPTLDSIQDFIFTPSCATAGCHTGAGAVLPGVMNLSNADASFMALVGVSSIQQAALQRVEAGNPDASYLIRKMENAAGITGTVMPPPPRPVIPQGDIDQVRLWITNGALRQ